MTEAIIAVRQREYRGVLVRRLGEPASIEEGCGWIRMVQMRLEQVNTRSNRERLLVWLFRAAGSVEAMAFLAAMMPLEWMARSHERLGFGAFPDDPIVRYLIRSVSFFYGVHGVLMWLVSMNPRRYRPLVVFIGLDYLVASPVIGWITIREGLPWWWTAGEGGTLAAVGVLTLFLLRSVPRVDVVPRG